jgi:hypothetical protein
VEVEIKKKMDKLVDKDLDKYNSIHLMEVLIENVLQKFVH